MTDYTSRGIAHHLDFRGKPTQRTDFDLITYGVDDHGLNAGGTTIKAPGISVTGTVKTQFGDGWIARANIDYLSSFLFRQTFSASFNEAIYSTTNSTAFVTKSFGYYTFNTDVSRNQDFESTAAGDSIIIRKLPEFDFRGREQQIASGHLPLWFSFDTSFGLFHRVEPIAEPGFYQTNQFTPRGNLAPTISTAFRWKGFSVMPSFTMHETFYGQSIANNVVRTSALNRAAPETISIWRFRDREDIQSKKPFWATS